MKWICEACNQKCDLKDSTEIPPISCPFSSEIIPAWTPIRKSKLTIVCRDCGREFSIKLNPKNQNPNATVDICTSCQEERHKLRESNRKISEQTQKQTMFTTCQACGQEFSFKSKDPARTNFESIKYCPQCHAEHSRNNRIKSEMRELNRKINRLGIPNFGCNHINSISMKESELKKHLRDGDVYVAE